MLPIFVVGMLVIGIGEVVYSGKKNVSQKEKFENFMSKTLEMKEDMFLRE